MHLPPRGIASTPLLLTKHGFAPLPAWRSPQQSNPQRQDLHGQQGGAGPPRPLRGGLDPLTWVYRTRAALAYCARWGRGARGVPFACKRRFSAADLRVLVLPPPQQQQRGEGDGSGASGGGSGGWTLEGSTRPFLASLERLEAAAAAAAADSADPADPAALGAAVASATAGQDGPRAVDPRFDVTLCAAAVLCAAPGKAGLADGMAQSDATARLFAKLAASWPGPRRFVVAACEEDPGASPGSAGAAATTATAHQASSPWAALAERAAEWHQPSGGGGDTTTSVLFLGSSSSEDSAPWGVSRKALLNAAVDGAVSRYVLPLPPGHAVSASAHASLVAAFAAQRTAAAMSSSLSSSSSSSSLSSSPPPPPPGLGVSLVLPVWEDAAACASAGPSASAEALLAAEDGVAAAGTALGGAMAEFSGRFAAPCSAAAATAAEEEEKKEEAYIWGDGGAVGTVGAKRRTLAVGPHQPHAADSAEHPSMSAEAVRALQNSRHGSGGGGAHSEHLWKRPPLHLPPHADHRAKYTHGAEDVPQGIRHSVQGIQDFLNSRGGGYGDGGFANHGGAPKEEKVRHSSGDNKDRGGGGGGGDGSGGVECGGLVLASAGGWLGPAGPLTVTAATGDFGQRKSKHGSPASVERGGNPPPGLAAAAPLVAWDAWSNPLGESGGINGAEGNGAEGTGGNSGEGNSGGGGEGMRLLSLRFVEELPFGCLDAAMAWAARELGATLAPAPTAAFAVALAPGQLGAVSTAGRGSDGALRRDVQHGDHGDRSSGGAEHGLAGWACGCGGVEAEAGRAWDDYRAFVRRAAAITDAIVGGPTGSGPLG